MLNLSPKNINNFENTDLSALKRVEQKSSSKKLMRTIYGLFLALFVITFLPWTQNIRSKGLVTTLRPEQRPQTVNTVISGKIVKWFVKDGDIVKKGDTILFISEIKDDYFDPNLVARTEKQLKNKELSVVSYSDKIKSLDSRVDALIETGRLKLQQTKIKLNQAQLKLKTDSIEFHTTQINYKIAENQYDRFEKLYKEGLKSQSELEARKLTLQRAQANQIAAQQKLMQSRNDIIDAKVEYNSVEAKYRDEVSKAESDKFSALTSMYDAEVDVTKLQSQVVNYSIRNGMYLILAPQDGVITKVLSSGIGETIKQGDAIATIMPSVYDLVIEMKVRPMDLPLIQKGQKVRVQFDGWPAIVFSGWPNTSFGTFGGEVYAVDNFAGEDGKFRVLIAPSKGQKQWPTALRVGGGTNSMILLNDVPIGYELWRLVNGFPPDFYDNNSTPIKKGK
ncbi:MAG: HlyD family secretion protein [Flavobacteriia bacterium]|jgi:adhesin transport system membrane fusion protein